MSESEQFYDAYYNQVGTDAVAVQPRLEGTNLWQIGRKVPGLLQPGEVAYEIGSGDGHMCSALAANGWRRVVGFDLSHSRTARARRLYPKLEFHDCLIEDSPVRTSSADLIVMEAVLEHLLNPREVISGLASYLKPGGHLVITTPNMDSGQYRFMGTRWTEMLAPQAHIFLFNAASALRLFEQAGLEIRLTGSLHSRPITAARLFGSLGKGDVKSFLWRLHREAAGLYGRAVRQGPMLFAVGRR